MIRGQRACNCDLAAGHVALFSVDQNSALAMFENGVRGNLMAGVLLMFRPILIWLVVWKMFLFSLY